MSSHPQLYALLRQVSLVTAIASAGALHAYAQEPQPPAYLTVVTGEATLERAGESEPATANMPFVPGDRLRTGAGTVEIAFPDGTAIEVGESSEVEAISPTRVRLIAGTMDHIQRAVASSQSAAYLPQDLQTYGSTFDQHGSWQYDQPYGYVWYPQVGPDWRPYSYGSWSPIRSYGWTWVGAEPWAWPTHHYGRWGFARNAWFWIPGRTWGAAWVSWSFADDYVSWCPLGWNSRPVFALSIGSRRGWDDWTVPRRSFGNRDAGFGIRRPSTLSTRSLTDSRRPSAESRPLTPESQIPSPGSRPSPASAVPRVGAREPFGNRDSGFARRDSGFAGRDSGFAGRDSGFGIRPSRFGIRDSKSTVAPDAPQTRNDRQTPDRRPTPESRSPTPDSRRQDAPSPSHGAAAGAAASAPRPTPHERAAPAGGDAGGQAQARRR